MSCSRVLVLGSTKCRVIRRKNFWWEIQLKHKQQKKKKKETYVLFLCLFFTCAVHKVHIPVVKMLEISRRTETFVLFP
jgi:hypothetical protein